MCAYPTTLVDPYSLQSWYGNKRKAWKDDLPKCLTVHFRYGKNYVMSAYNLSLDSEGHKIQPQALHLMERHIKKATTGTIS